MPQMNCHEPLKTLLAANPLPPFRSSVSVIARLRLLVAVLEMAFYQVNSLWIGAVAARERLVGVLPDFIVSCHKIFNPRLGMGNDRANLDPAGRTT